MEDPELRLIHHGRASMGIEINLKHLLYCRAMGSKILQIEINKGGIYSNQIIRRNIRHTAYQIVRVIFQLWLTILPLPLSLDLQQI